MKTLKRIISSVIFAGIIFSVIDIHAAEVITYEPTRESLSQHTVPEWYRDAKIGMFYHWGPGSVPGPYFSADVINFFQQKPPYEGTAKKNPTGQWGANMYPRLGYPENEQNATYLFHRDTFGDPSVFGYKELIPLMSADNFDPEGMVQLMDEAGIKYVVPMAVHHDGFAMWDSQVIDQYNAVKMGPMTNTTKLVIDAARARGLKVGVSTHVCRHSWYYPHVAGYDVSDPQYIQLYGEGKASGGLPKPEAMQKWEDTLGELVDLFHPDYIFVDGGTADIYSGTGSYVVQDAFRRIVANYYNKSQTYGVEPVITFKRESLWKEEAVPDYEGGFLSDIAPYKWQTHSSNAGWFYRKGTGVTASHVNFRKIIDTVSKNGNMLLNLAIMPDGGIQEGEILFLQDMAAWTSVLGEGIYATRPWLVYCDVEPADLVLNTSTQGKVYIDPDAVPLGTAKLNATDIRYTRSRDAQTVYATMLGAPVRDFTLTAFGSGGVGQDIPIKSITRLGSSEKVVWMRTDAGIEIEAPSTPVFANTEWPVMYKLETGVESDPPTPNPAGFAVLPAAENTAVISMTAMTGSDQGAVEYYFSEVSGHPGGSDSGWQRSPFYADAGLMTNTEYSYTVQMRDQFQNTGAASAPASAFTLLSSDVLIGWETESMIPSTVPSELTGRMSVSGLVEVAGNVGSIDGTFGTHAGASTNPNDGGFQVYAGDIGATYRFTLALTNAGLVDINLETIHFDAWRLYGNSPSQWSVTYLDGDLAETNDTLIASGDITKMAQSITNGVGADYEDFDITLASGLATDTVLGSGESARFEIAIFGQLKASPGATYVDNIAVVGMAGGDSADRDGDGIPDDWEITNFGSATNATADSDYDGDGMIDLHEWMAGTDPKNSASALKFEAVAPSSTNANTLVIQWQSISGKSYRVMSTDALEGSWMTNRSGIQATAPSNTEPVPMDSASSFFRIELE